jgi:archaellum component FlaF (FlaF/FlaG flagellin family)
MGAMKRISTMLNGAGYTYVSGARIIATVLDAKNARYSASASSTTCRVQKDQSDISQNTFRVSITYVGVCRREQRDQDIDKYEGGDNIPEVIKCHASRA